MTPARNEAADRIDVGELRRLIEAATPLLECGHRANRPQNDSGERLVGFVIDQDLVGLGLSEPLFALEAVVKLAKSAADAEAENERLREAMERAEAKFRHYDDLHRLKCTAEGDEKADRNREMADMCRTALTGDQP